MFKIQDGRKHFFQWDLNQKLIVEDNTITEVHFCNKTGECALVCEVYKENGVNVVNVPNILLQDNWTLRVYAVAADHTEHEEHYKVKVRSKPDDYIYTETETKTFELLEKRMDDLENSVTEEGISKAIEDYLTENPVEVDLTGYATEDFVNNAVNSIEIPEIPDLSPYALKKDIPSVEGLASETYVNEAISNIDFPETDLSNYYTKAETNTAINKAKPDLTTYAKKTEIPSIEGLATENYVDNAIDTIEFPETDLSNYYTKQETNTEIEKSKQDLTPYAKRTALLNYYNKQETETAINTVNNNIDKAVEAMEKEINNVANKIPTKTSELTNDSKFITEDNTEEIIESALTQAKASGEFNGKDGTNGTNGKDGISCTHSWNGTTLTVTSSSGTSSADLKGEKGDAYTLTTADKTAITNSVIASLNIETWIFTLEDDSTVSKVVLLK